MRLILIFTIIFLISIISVNAVPFFVSINSNDQDNVYGVNDRLVNLTVTMNSNRYTIFVNFLNMETGANGTQKVINNNDGTYTINYTILSPSSTNPINLSVTAFDPIDSTFVTNNSFNVIMDNTNPVIVSQTKTPFISFNTDNLILNGTINDNFGIKQAFITGNWEGIFKNYSTITNISNVYSHQLNSSFLTNGQILIWKYAAIDKANNVGEGFLVITRLNNQTNLSISPSTPNGINGWYTVEPIITLLGDLNSSTTFFRFGNSILTTYVAPFNRTNTINGIQKLFYFTNFTNNVSNRTEDIQNITLFVDTKKPAISNLQPANNSFTGVNGKISAVIDDVFLANSGLNLSTVKLFLDYELTNAIVTKINNLSATINLNFILNNGNHNVTVNGMDIAGNNASLTWTFTVNPNNNSLLNVDSPGNLNYNANKILINISINQKVKLFYYDNFDNKTVLLCSVCNSFKSFLSFKDGEHKIKFIASDNASNNVSQDITFFVDNVKPVILSLNFKNKSITNSTFFEIRYTEKFLQNISFFYKLNTSSSFNAVNLNNCLNGTNMKCNLSLSNTGLDGKTIIYYFVIKDKINNATSKKQNILFDFSNPFLSILNLNSTYKTKSVRFDIKSNEKLKSLSYTDNGKNIPLCTNCISYNKTNSFSNGSHNITFKAVDLVGNSNMFNKTFNIII